MHNQDYIPIQTVRIADIEMSFGSMVSFMVKWAFAAIPAIIIIFFILFMGATILTALFGGLGAGLNHLPVR